MIITRLKGGLGNQFFQYAFGRYLATRNNTKLILDTRDYRHQPKHGLQLHHFNIDMEFASDDFLEKFPITWIDHTTADTAYEDLYLMRQADCCITANSTLSWWGDWLGKRPAHTVYTPAQWFRPGTLNGKALTCDGGVQMPSQPSPNSWVPAITSAA